MLKLISSVIKLVGKPIWWVLLAVVYVAGVVANNLDNLLTGLRHAIVARKPKLKKKTNPKKIRLPGMAFVTGLVLTIGVGMVGGIKIGLFLQSLPDINRLTELPALTSKITDREGKVLYKFYKNENRTWVPLAMIPEGLVQATLAIEDKDFYKHNGISWKGVLRAVWHNWRYPERPMMGGSTITQQLVKNTLLTQEKTWGRKVKEVLLAVAVEWKYSKEDILENYFNQIPYGGELYGAQEAALCYLGKNVWEINRAEAAFLAGIPASPTTYSPTGSRADLSFERQAKVLGEMVTAGFITDAEREELANQNLSITTGAHDIKAPHFVFYVRDWLKQELAIDQLEKRGLTIVTTLDLTIQQMAETVLTEELGKVQRLRISNGAVLVTKPSTGEILAMVGSKNYFDQKIDGFVNVVLSPRQPGSAIKPITYLSALQNGFTPATIILDAPITYKSKGQEDYTPRNYDNTYRGNVTLRTALASSLNIPAVKVLSAVGVESMLSLGEKMGISTWGEKNRFGLALTLGGGEVKMIDMAEVYGTLANLGERVQLNPVLEIKNFKDQVVYTAEKKASKVVAPENAFLINDILADNEARSPVFGSRSMLVVKDKTVAVKTGTTNSLRDNWCLGYTPSVLVAVWVGNNDNSPMSWVASGVSGATPIWHSIIESMLATKDREAWWIPEELEKVSVCKKAGTLPCDGCPSSEEWFVKGTAPTKHCVVPPVTPTITL